jgi:DNA-3-methyladenine glycosylase II
VTGSARNDVAVERMGPSLAPRAARHLRRHDPVLGAVIARVGPCAIVPRGDPYRYLVRAVLFQQITGHAGRAIEGRLKAAYGGKLPSPDKLRAAPAPKLRGVGLSRQKIASLHAIATAFDDGTLVNRRLARLDDEAVIEAVTQLRGVGEWTAHMMLMMSLGRPDVLPVGDYGVRKAARDLYGLADLPKPKELVAIAEPWRPYRSIAAWYLWRSMDAVTP